ncbi:MAG: hydrolase [Christensenella sp.]|nr:hydrolase [Christensenella sp.]
MQAKEFESKLRYLSITMPDVISQAPGINIFGRTLRSFLFTTDSALIKNTNADAVMAVYPFPAQPAINQAILSASFIPVMCSVSGGEAYEERVLHMAMEAEFRGAFGAVLDPATDIDVIAKLKKRIDIPVVVTVVSDKEDLERKIESGADILNVSGAENTCKIIEKVRNQYPYMPIIATGGPTDETIRETIECGADAITYTPPSNAELFRMTMQLFRERL